MLPEIGARYYYPGLARWTQQDLLTGNLMRPTTMNRYTYAGCSPTNYADPSGLSDLGDCLIFGAGAFVGGAVAGAAAGFVATAPLGGVEGAVLGGLVGGFAAMLGVCLGFLIKDFVALFSLD